jgi:F0F1-type ATP synthase delta subunit
MVKEYVQALSNLTRAGMDEGEAYIKLHAHLKASGRLKILPQLARELRRHVAEKAGSAPLLEVASEAERSEAEKAAHAAGIAIKAVVNPDLIRGWRLRANGTITDRSAKRSLVELYRNVTA